MLVKEYIYVSSQVRKIWKIQFVQMNLHINDTVICLKLNKKTSPLYILMKNGEAIVYLITAEFAWTSTVMGATNFLMVTIVLSYSEFNIYSNQHYSVLSFIMTLFGYKWGLTSYLRVENSLRFYFITFLNTYAKVSNSNVLIFPPCHISF